jgi:hypothetical protein
MYSKEDEELFEPIRTRITRFRALDILDICLKVMRRTESNPDKWYAVYQPWKILLLMKWTLIHGNFTFLHLPYSFKEPQLQEVLSEIQKLEDTLGKERDEAGWLLFFRKLAFQQFPLQQIPYQSSFARQSLLFSDLPPDAELRHMFLEQVGLEIEDFIELELLLIPKFLVNREGSVDANWFRTVESHYPCGAIANFLESLSLDISGARNFLTQDWDRHQPELRYELFEMSLLKKRPLLKYNDRYHCYSERLLYRGLEHYVYDNLRMVNPQVFGNEFGKGRFEEYVGKALAYTELPMITERDLSKIIRKGVGLVDYVAVDQDVNVFIEAKAVEATYIAEVTEDVQVIINRLRSSVIEAIEKANQLVQELETVTAIAGVELGTSEERYLLVVTYGDLFLGSGNDFYRLIAKDALDEILAKSNGRQWIPYVNIYFVSLENFDLFVEVVHKGRIRMTDVLRRAVAADASAVDEQRKFIFRQHLFEIAGDLDVPKYLSDEFQRIFDNTGSKLRH